MLLFCELDLIVFILQQVIVILVVESLSWNINLWPFVYCLGIWGSSVLLLTVKQLQVIDQFKGKLPSQLKAHWTPKSFEDARQDEQFRKILALLETVAKLTCFVELVRSGALSYVARLPVHLVSERWIRFVTNNYNIQVNYDPRWIHFVFVSLLMPVFCTVDLPFRIYIKYYNQRRLGTHLQFPVHLLQSYVWKLILLSVAVMSTLPTMMVLTFVGDVFWHVSPQTSASLEETNLPYNWILSIPIMYTQMSVLKSTTDLEDVDTGKSRLSYPHEPLRSRLTALANRVSFPAKHIVVDHIDPPLPYTFALFERYPEYDLIVMSAGHLTDTFTGEEIEAIVAHELGHWKIQNSKEYGSRFQFTEELQMLLISFLAFCFLIFPERLTFSIWFLIVMSVESQVWIVHFHRRREEYEADAFAVKLGYGSYSLAALSKDYEQNAHFPVRDKFAAARQSTHPSLMSRIDAIEKLLRENEGKAKSSQEM